MAIAQHQSVMEALGQAGNEGEIFQVRGLSSLRTII